MLSFCFINSRNFAATRFIKRLTLRRCVILWAHSQRGKGASRWTNEFIQASIIMQFARMRLNNGGWVPFRKRLRGHLCNDEQNVSSAARIRRFYEQRRAQSRFRISLKVKSQLHRAAFFSAK